MNQRGYCEKRDDGVLEALIPAKYNSLPRDARVVIEKSDGTTLYITRSVCLRLFPFQDENFIGFSRDIAALKSRLETMSIDKILYVVSQ